MIQILIIPTADVTTRIHSSFIIRFNRVGTMAPLDGETQVPTPPIISLPAAGNPHPAAHNP